MPKSKETVTSSDDSKSSESEVEVKKSKKRSKDDSDKEDKKRDSKKPKKQSKPRKASESEGEDDTWELGNMKRVTVREFKGKTLIDIREYYESNGEYKPGKKGISLNPQQWRKLADKMEDVTKAVSKKG